MTVLAASGFVVTLLLVHGFMSRRHEGVFERMRPEVEKIVIPKEARFADVAVIPHSEGAWYLGGGGIDIGGTVPTADDAADLKKLVRAAQTAYPVSFLSLEIRNADESKKFHWSEHSANQLKSYFRTNVFRFWGWTPWMLPVLLLAISGRSRSPETHRFCDFGMLAWALWIICFHGVEGRWFWNSAEDAAGVSTLVLPIVGAWVWLAKARILGNGADVLRLLAPGGLVVMADALYGPINSGVLVERFGCGCKLDGMNTNHITSAFFVLVWVASLVCAVVTSREVSRLFRVAYFVVVGAGTFWLSRMLMDGNCWL